MGMIMFCVNEIFDVRCNGSGHEYISKIMRYSKHVPSLLLLRWRGGVEEVVRQG